MSSPTTIPGMPNTWTPDNMPADAYSEAGSGTQPVGLGSAKIKTLYQIPRTLNVKLYGAKVDGATDDTTAVNNALAAAASSQATVVFIPSGICVTSGTLIVSNGASLVGSSLSASSIHYSGSGSAVRLNGAAGSSISMIAIVTSNAAASGLEAGNACRNCNVFSVSINASAPSSGAGFFLNAGTGYSSQLYVENAYVTGFKFGVKFSSTDLTTNTWTACTFVNCQLAGATGPVSASAGVYFDATTNGVGTMFIGGSIETFALGVQHLTGGQGGTFRTNMEGNTVNYSVGTTFNGTIETLSPVNSLWKGTNGASNVWEQERHAEGTSPVVESYYGYRRVIYSGSGTPDEEAWYRGASIIDGGTPTKIFAIGMGDGAGNPATRYIYLDGNKIAFSASGAPTSGTWALGDVVLNRNIGNFGTPDDFVVGWICSNPGTPGTWRAFRYAVDLIATINPGPIAANTLYQETVTFSGQGFVLGSFLQWAPGVDTTGLFVSAVFKGSASILLSIYNGTGSPITLASSSWTFRGTR